MSEAAPQPLEALVAAAVQVLPEALQRPELETSIAAFLDKLMRTNLEINLVSRRNTLEHVARFTRECLFLARILDEDRARLAGRRRALRLLDLGSGGGFPGILLKLALPEIETQLVEATQKKARFLADVCAELGLHKCGVVWGRGEDLAERGGPLCRPEFRHHFDWVTAKALGTVQSSTRLAEPFLAPEGAHWTFKGAAYEEEMRAASGVFRQRGLAPLRVEPIPGDIESYIVGIRRLPRP